MVQKEVPDYFGEKEVQATHTEHVKTFSDEERSISTVATELSDRMKLVEKKLVRRLDFIYAMPCICVLMMIQVHMKKKIGLDK